AEDPQRKPQKTPKEISGRGRPANTYICGERVVPIRCQAPTMRRTRDWSGHSLAEVPGESASMSGMAQQSSLTFFENANSQPDFTVVLRGYDRPQVDDFVQRLNAALAQSEAARAEAEQRLAEAQRRARQAEQALTQAQQKLTDQSKQLEESSRPTLSGLGTRVEQILRLAEEQANEHRSESKREAEGIISAARLEAREITDKARAEAAAMKANAEREASNLRTAVEREVA